MVLVEFALRDPVVTLALLVGNEYAETGMVSLPIQVNVQSAHHKCFHVIGFLKILMDIRG
jgi:hypothetical protein